MIRKARKEDVKIVISLLALAMNEFILNLSAADNESEALELLSDFFLKKNNRLSYENIFVYEEENQILAALCLYDGAKADFLDKALNENAKKRKKAAILKECENDYYIDSIGVRPSARGKGIATKLILYAYNLAKKDNKKLSLIVEENNHKAKKLYENLGFVFDKYKEFHGHKYLYMVKG